VQLNACGEIVREEWLRTPVVRTNVTLDEFVVMPNHMHMIVILAGAARARPSLEDRANAIRPYGVLSRVGLSGSSAQRAGLFWMYSRMTCL
jgi:REP element-mobilizing transposase RayT